MADGGAVEDVAADALSLDLRLDDLHFAALQQGLQLLPVHSALKRSVVNFKSKMSTHRSDIEVV